MSGSRHQRRSSWIAFAAIWGAFLATAGTAEASMTGRRDCDSAALASCCPAGRPETCNQGCCTSSAPALPQTGTEESAATVGLSSPRTTCVPTACQCRSSEPATPDSKKPERRTADDRFDLGENLPSAWLGYVLLPAPAALVPRDVGGALQCPLQLLTTHLRF
jgi:hypothetical protein